MSEHQTRKRQIENRKMSVKRISKYDLDYTNYVNKMNSSGYTAYSKEKYLSKRDNANREYQNQLNSMKEHLRSEYRSLITSLEAYISEFESVNQVLAKYNREWYHDQISQLKSVSNFSDLVYNYEAYSTNIPEIDHARTDLIFLMEGMQKGKDFLYHLLDCLRGEEAGI